MRDASVFMFVTQCIDWFEAARFRRLLRRVDSTIESLEKMRLGYASFSTEQLKENLDIGAATLKKLNCEIVFRRKEAGMAWRNSDEELLCNLDGERYQLRQRVTRLKSVTDFFKDYHEAYK